MGRPCKQVFAIFSKFNQKIIIKKKMLCSVIRQFQYEPCPQVTWKFLFFAMGDVISSQKTLYYSTYIRQVIVKYNIRLRHIIDCDTYFSILCEYQGQFISIGQRGSCPILGLSLYLVYIFTVRMHFLYWCHEKYYFIEKCVIENE